MEAAASSADINTETFKSARPSAEHDLNHL